MDIERKLNHLGRMVYQTYPHINLGGCCVFAAIVAEELIKHDIQAVGIVAAWSAGRHSATIDKARINIRKNTINEWKDNGIALNHVGLEFKIKGKKKHYDTNGIIPALKEFDSMPIYKGRLQLGELKALAAKRSGWNETFSRRNIPALRQLIKEHLAVDAG